MRRLLLVCVVGLAACAWGLDGYTGGSTAERADGGALKEGGSGSSSSSGGKPSADAAAGMGQIAFVQTVARSFVASNALILRGVGAHNTLVLALTSDAPSVTVTDNVDSIYTTVVGPTPNSGSHASILAAFDVQGGDMTIRATANGTVSYLLVYASEYSGVAAFDVGVAVQGSTVGPDGLKAPLMTARPSELLVGYGFCNIRVEAGTGFTTRSTLAANIFEDRILDTAGANIATATMPTPGAWQMLGAAFRGP